MGGDSGGLSMEEAGKPLVTLEIEANEDRINRLLETISEYARGLREGHALADSLQRHEDSIAVWIIGLAAGAIIALPAGLSYVVQIKHIPRWALALSILPFVLAVLTGVGHRLILAAMMEKDKLYAFAKIHALEVLRFRRFAGEPGVKKLVEEVLGIMDNKPNDIAELKIGLDGLRWWAIRLMYCSPILFGLGIVIVAFIVIFLR
jgi:hypothetical protein